MAMFENNIIWILLVGLVGIWISLDFIQAMFSSIKEGKEEEEELKTDLLLMTTGIN